MKQHRLYNELAHLWPLLSPPEDYAAEAQHCLDLLRDALGEGRHEILELGAGGGHHLSHLMKDFKATAVDLSEKMLEISMALNPDVEHHAGDMRSVRLGKTFKAVLIHDAINYMLTEDDLNRAFATAAAHLDPGGVLVAAPDFFRETFSDPLIDHETRTDGKTELTYIEYTYDPDPGDSTIETIMFFLLREKGTLRIEQDHHVIGLFPRATWFRLLEESGFRIEEGSRDIEHRPELGGLIVGRLNRSRDRG